MAPKSVYLYHDNSMGHDMWDGINQQSTIGLFFRRLLSKFGMIKPIYEYEVTASVPFGVVTTWGSDSHRNRYQLFCEIEDIKDQLKIDTLTYREKKIKCSYRNYELYRKMFPESHKFSNFKPYTGIAKMITDFTSSVFAKKVYLYFEDESIMVAFQLMR